MSKRLCGLLRNRQSSKARTIKYAPRSRRILGTMILEIYENRISVSIPRKIGRSLSNREWGKGNPRKFHVMRQDGEWRIDVPYVKNASLKISA